MVGLSRAALLAPHKQVEGVLIRSPFVRKNPGAASRFLVVIRRPATRVV